MAQSLKNPTSANFVQKTIGATFLTGASVLTLNSVTSIQNLPGVAIIDRIDTNSVETPTKREVISFTGTSGVTLVGVVKNADGSGTDQDHAVGAIVEFGPDILWAQSIIDGLTQVIVASTGLVDTTKVVTPTGTQTLTNKTITSPLGITGTDVGLGNVNNTSNATERAATATLTNKRITKRVLLLSANSATPAINTDSYDVVHITSQTTAITSFTSGLTGTPVDGDTLRISVTGTGAVGLTFGSSFEASGGTPLSTTTVTTARLDMGFLWNSETSKWRQVAQA